MSAAQEDPAVLAFAALTKEVGELSRTIESLVSKSGADAAVTSELLENLAGKVDKLQPASFADPKSWAAMIAPLVVATCKEALASELSRSRSQLEASQNQLVRLADRLSDFSYWAAAALAGAGMLAIFLWILVSGPIARALPKSWRVAETSAAALLGSSLWDGGARMMSADDPDRARLIFASDRLVQANAATLAGCVRAAKTKGPVSCEIIVGADPDLASAWTIAHPGVHDGEGRRMANGGQH